MDDYTQGMEDGVILVKQIFELSQVERVNKFGSRNVADILDKFDFIQIKEKLAGEEVCTVYYVIRVFTEKGYVLHTSERMKIQPTSEIVLDYIMRYPGAEFAKVETLFVRETK